MSSVPPEVAEMHTRLFNVIADPKFSRVSMAITIATVVSILEHLIKCCPDRQEAERLADSIMSDLRASHSSIGAMPS